MGTKEREVPKETGRPQARAPGRMTWGWHMDGNMMSRARRRVGEGLWEKVKSSD